MIPQLGLKAMSWVAEGGGLSRCQERDGLAWAITLNRLWEGYVEAPVRRETALTGGEVKVGRLGMTVVPIRWTDPLHRSPRSSGPGHRRATGPYGAHCSR
jgi:hypothetical protein